MHNRQVSLLHLVTEVTAYNRPLFSDSSIWHFGPSATGISKCKVEHLVEHLLDPFRNILDQTLRILPANTGISDRLPVDALADFLTATFQIGLDHETLDHGANVLGVAAGMQDFLADTGLLLILLR